MMRAPYATKLTFDIVELYLSKLALSWQPNYMSTTSNSFIRLMMLGQLYVVLLVFTTLAYQTL